MYDRSPLFCRPWHLASSASVETQPNRDRDGSRPRVTQRVLCETVAPGVPSPNSWARGAPFYGTRKGTVLESVPLSVATWTFPVVAPAGTVVVISELETTVNTAAVPLKVTLVAPVRSLPRMLRAAPTLPERGRVFTNGPRPTDRLKTEPSSACPPYTVVP